VDKQRCYQSAKAYYFIFHIYLYCFYRIGFIINKIIERNPSQNLLFDKLTQINQKKTSKYKFDSWIFDSQKSLLISTTKEIKIPKLQNDLLILFVNNSNTVLTRELIINQLWGNKIVNEEALSRLVAELRKQLNDSAKNPKYIKTLPKKGYEFIQQAEEVLALGVTASKINRYLFIVLFLVLAISTSYYFRPIQAENEKHHQVTQALAFAKRITASPGLERQPVISASGNKLAYAKSINGKSIVVIENLSDGEIKKIQAETFSFGSPVFSNDELSLAMSAFDGEKCQILIHNLTDNQQQWIGSCQIKNNSKILSWSKDDSKIYHVALEDQFNTNAIWELDLDSMESKQVTFPTSSDLFDSNPNISPNGQTISFNRGNHSVQNIYLKNLTGIDSELINLTHDQNYTVSHYWFDNESLIYDSDKTGNRKLWMMNILSRESHLLGARGAQFPSFSNTSNQLAYQVAEYEANIWMMDLSTQLETRVIHSTKYDNNPAFNHQGTQFAFTSNREDHGVILVYDFASQSEKKIFEIPETKLTRPLWSKDDGKIIASGNSLDGYWSYEIDLTTAAYKKIPLDQENFASFYFQDEIYALSKPSQGESNLLKLNSSNRTIELPLKGISRIMPIDENHLVISKANKNGLFLINIDDFSIQTILADFPSNYLNYWTALDSELYYVNKDSNFSIWKYNINTDKHSKVTDSFPNSVGPTLSVSPDKSMILITKTDRAESDVFIAELPN
jgi:Tol biopolymer transport system component/DNA-binding winged helix-turn-helix (wHTH) protein